MAALTVERWRPVVESSSLTLTLTLPGLALGSARPHGPSASIKLYRLAGSVPQSVGPVPYRV